MPCSVMLDVRCCQVRWFFILPLCVFLARTGAHATDLFEFERAGRRLVFSVPDDGPRRAATADATQAANDACRWLLYRFHACEPDVEAVAFCPAPVRHWVVAVSATVAAHRETLYAVVLIDGTPVEPTFVAVERSPQR